MNGFADLNEEKIKRGLRVRVQAVREPVKKQKIKQEINYNNVWYMIFFWLLFLKLVDGVQLSWAGVLCPIIFFVFVKIKSW